LLEHEETDEDPDSQLPLLYSFLSFMARTASRGDRPHTRFPSFLSLALAHAHAHARPHTHCHQGGAGHQPGRDSVQGQMRASALQVRPLRTPRPSAAHTHTHHTHTVTSRRCRPSLLGLP
jgi:hypothetical protein